MKLLTSDNFWSLFLALSVVYVAYKLTGNNAIVWLVPIAVLSVMVHDLRERVKKLEKRLEQSNT